MPELHQIETAATPYERALQHLLALGHELGSNRKFDLEHMRALADALGNPQRRFASINDIVIAESDRKFRWERKV